MHAVMHLFVAFVSATRGGCGRVSDDDPFRKFLKEFEIYLPLLAAIATGRFELVLDCLKRLAESLQTYAENPLVSKVELVIDVLTLLGIDQALYEDMTNRGEEFVPTLLDNIFTALNVQSDDLRNIIQQLVTLLVGICVDAQPDNLQKQIWELCDPLERYVQRLVQGNEQMGRSIAVLVQAAKDIASMVAKGQNINQMGLLSAVETAQDGQDPMGVQILKAVIDLVLPFMPQDVRKPVISVLKVLNGVANLAANPTLSNFARHRVDIIENVADALCIPKRDISGILALAQGNWSEAVELCKPIADINPEVMSQISKLLPNIKRTIAPNLGGENDLKSLAESNGIVASRIKQIAEDAVRNKGSALELFELTDLDGNGRISTEEFQLLMTRLGLTLSPHRMTEILSMCKRGLDKRKAGEVTSEDLSGLSLEEFKVALDYLQKKMARDSISLLGHSWGRLMWILSLLITGLILLMVFIWLGINAFVTGGVFNSIVNSVMTISSGIALWKKQQSAEQNSENNDKIKNMVQEVQDTVFSQQ